MDTKEKILMTALHLFARHGYEAVSVSMIAEELGITKGALYRHYKNKRDIFDSIVKRMFELDAERAREYEVPEHLYEEQEEEYESVSVEQVMEFTSAQLTFWTEDDFASHFRKMLVLEQYRDEEIGKLYNDCIVEGPISYLEDIFREMMERKRLKKEDPKLLAAEFYGPVFLWIQILDRDNKITVEKNKEGKNEEKKNEVKELLQKHMNEFFMKFAFKSKENGK
ncbi:MAG: TetR/AcrR family transcriptional regulator [Lachnospiraceae bacterium]|nr:TetR/AcrR family transcriptional regulator [Lachnospiraceae bacterium]